MVTVRLSADTEKKLNKLTRATMRSKSFYIKEALERYLDDMEDFYIALDRLSKPDSRYYTTKELKEELDL